MTSSSSIFESELSVDDTAAALEAAAAEANWGHLATHDLAARMAARGINFPVPVRIVEICHPEYANGVLSDDLEISAAMPCRVAIFEKEGKTWMSTILPSKILPHYSMGENGNAAGETAEKELLEILQKASS